MIPLTLSMFKHLSACQVYYSHFFFNSDQTIKESAEKLNCSRQVLFDCEFKTICIHYCSMICCFYIHRSTDPNLPLHPLRKNIFSFKTSSVNLLLESQILSPQELSGNFTVRKKKEQTGKS